MCCLFGDFFNDHGIIGVEDQGTDKRENRKDNCHPGDDFGCVDEYFVEQVLFGWFWLIIDKENSLFLFDDGGLMPIKRG
jgi:hypothetical protein